MLTRVQKTNMIKYYICPEEFQGKHTHFHIQLSLFPIHTNLVKLKHAVSGNYCNINIYSYTKTNKCDNVKLKLLKSIVPVLY